jgi:hypothetical protein
MPKATAKTNAVNNTNQLGNAVPPDFRRKQLQAGPKLVAG